MTDAFRREPDEPHIVRFPPIACSWCGTLVDATFASDVSRTIPAAGNVTICLECGLLSVFVFSPLGVPSLRRLTRRESREYERLHHRTLSFIRGRIAARHAHE